MSKPLSLRQEQVLQATVHHYVDTMEPVGSRTLVQRFGIPASSATVRSAMGALERSSAPMAERTVAELAGMPKRCTRVRLPTGSIVST